ncbi:MAG: ABC transporter permease [Actinobacteria bacterium]|nr:ABC transporter permease [Actinomycetota bacterium]
MSGVVLILALWQIAASAGLLDPLVASSPSKIFTAARRLISEDILGPAILSTAKLFGVGFGVSLVSGLAIGAALGWYPRLAAVLDPWVSILYAVPRIALLPIISVWVGIGFEAQVIVVWLVAVFPIVINTQSGISTVDRDHLQVARGFLATDWQVLRTVAIPGATPAIVSGIRQGLMQGLIGVVLAEYFFGNTGIGGLIFSAGTTLETATAFVGAFIFAAAALLFSVALKAIERRLERWRG